MTNPTELQQLITRAIGTSAAERNLAYESATLSEVLRETAVQLLPLVEPVPGASALLSAAWALHLRDRYNIPAVAVTGDLRIGNQWVYRETLPLPPFSHSEARFQASWKGHGWVEIGGWLCDIALFRMAYGLGSDSPVRQQIETQFGLGRGAFVVRADAVPEGLRYRRRAVLNNAQLLSLFKGLSTLMERRSAAEGALTRH